MMYVPQRRNEDGFLKKVMGFIKWFFIMTGVSVTLGFVSLALMAGGAVHSAGSSISDNIILTYTFKAGLEEIVSGPSLSQPLLRTSNTFHEVIDALTEAAKDKRVKGFVARLQDIKMTPAQLQELRDTLAKFRAAGKPAYIYADDFGGFSSGMGDYYLASSFSQVWLQPVGTVSMNGVAVEVPFFKGIMDKVGVDAEFSRKGTYKSMPESLTLTGMSAPHREMMIGLVADLSDQITAGIAASRKMSVGDVRKLVNDAPFTGEEALQLKLIDKIGYYDQMLDDAKHAAGKDAETVTLEDYSSHEDSSPSFDRKSKAKIALIIGAGDIISYNSESHASLRGGDMAANKIASAFEDARKDKDVAAVVFRIDSPGGSPEAAETIRHAIVETQKKGKPVIVSMGGYAASGGYWIASPADKIVAEPATITGSIGVFGGKFVLAGLWDKLGVHWDNVSQGNNALMWSANVPFTEKQRNRFEAMLDDIYQAFIARVMEGRHMTHEQVEAVAEGHVWTGRQAKERGLVDELGGLDKAVMLAKAAAKLKPDQDVPLERFPAKKSPLEMLMQLVSGDDDASVLPSILEEGIMQRLQAEADSETGILKMPDVLMH